MFALEVGGNGACVLAAVDGSSVLGIWKEVFSHGGPSFQSVHGLEESFF